MGQVSNVSPWQRSAQSDGDSDNDFCADDKPIEQEVKTTHKIDVLD